MNEQTVEQQPELQGEVYRLQHLRADLERKTQHGTVTIDEPTMKKLHDEVAAINSAIDKQEAKVQDVRRAVCERLGKTCPPEYRMIARRLIEAVDATANTSAAEAKFRADMIAAGIVPTFRVAVLPTQVADWSAWLADVRTAYAL